MAEPTPGGPNFKGVDRQAAGCLPPDTHGAVGLTHYLEIVNCRVRVFDKSNNALVRDQNLSAFFGDTDFDFDPRALYDSTWNRFVVVATRKADSPTDAQRYYWIGVSTTSNPTGNFHVYRVNFGFNPGDWCDYPQLGMDQDAIIVTCNMFHVNNPNGASNFVRTYVISIAKARLYNGQGFSVSNFLPGFASIAPPLVSGLPMQQSNKSYLVAADPGADVIRLLRMENTARPSETTLVLQANVPVPAWDIPPVAFNGGGPLLDTLDGRFQNNSAQNGTSLWAVHSERIVRNGVPYSRPRFYEINTSTNTLLRNGIFFLDFTSDDWNSSLAVNANQQVFFTFSSARANLFPQIRTEGCEVVIDNCNVFGGGDIGPGTLIQSSSRSATTAAAAMGTTRRSRWTRREGQVARPTNGRGSPTSTSMQATTSGMPGSPGSASASWYAPCSDASWSRRAKRGLPSGSSLASFCLSSANPAVAVNHHLSVSVGLDDHLQRLAGQPFMEGSLHNVRTRSDRDLEAAVRSRARLGHHLSLANRSLRARRGHALAHDEVDLRRLGRTLLTLPLRRTLRPDLHNTTNSGSVRRGDRNRARGG